MNILVTSGMHPPQPVPALVVFLISSIVVAPLLTHVVMSSFETFLIQNEIQLQSSELVNTYVTTTNLSIAFKIVTVFFPFRLVAKNELGWRYVKLFLLLFS